jgi:hypothetical protein
MGSLFGSSSGAAHPELAEATDAALAALRAGSGQVAGTEVRARAHERDEGSARARSRGSTRTAPGKTQKRDREPSSPRRCSPRAFADTTATPRALIPPPPPFPPSPPAGDVPRGSVGVRERVRSRGVVWFLARAETRLRRRRRARAPARLRARARDREARERPERRGRAHAAPVPAARADDPSAPRGVPLRPRGRGESLDAVFPLPGSRRGRARGRARRFEPPRIGIPRDPVRGVPRRRIIGRVRVRDARRGGGDGEAGGGRRLRPRGRARRRRGGGARRRPRRAGGRVARELARGEPLELDRGVGDGRARSRPEREVGRPVHALGRAQGDGGGDGGAEPPEKTARGVEPRRRPAARRPRRGASGRHVDSRGASARPPWRRSRTSPPSS